jgi:predicted site-specific integrase-resolvase
MTNANSPSRPTKAGWRINEWAADAGVSSSYAYMLLKAGDIKSVKIGAMRIIVTRPEDFLAALADD